MVDTLSLDYETFSEIDLPKAGSSVYARHESTEALLLGWKLNDEETEVIDLANGEWVPRIVREALLDPEVVKRAWNAPFEYYITKYVMGIDVPMEQWRDTMVDAMYLSLPGKLEKVGEIIGLSEDKKKITRGKTLIRKFCKPRKPTKNKPWTRDNAETAPEEWEEFIEYCGRDVDAEYAIKKKLRRWPMPEHELETWFLDREINEFGIPINMDVVHNAIKITDYFTEKKIQEMKDITGLDNPNSNAQIKPWLQAHGYPYDDMQKGHVERALEDLFQSDADYEDNPDLYEVLERRLEVSKSSVKKFPALAVATDEDGMLRDCFQFTGAQRTHRWCLAEGTRVLTKSEGGVVEEVPIEDVSDAHLVWDGTDWVKHEGVVYSGRKKVVEHDGVTATSRHVVFLSDSRKCTLGEAKEADWPLWEGVVEWDTRLPPAIEPPGHPVRTYDIVNAGPKNRFMANGKIVSNSGRRYQPQNLAKPTKEFEDCIEEAVHDVERLRPRAIEVMYDKPLDLISSCVRPVCQAKPGYIFCDADLSAIENRVIGWLAGDEAILDVFRQGRDPYVDFGRYMFDKSYEELWHEYKVKGNKEKRTLCKPGVLGCGFMLGKGKVFTNQKTGEKMGTGLLGYAWNMGIDMTPEQAELSVNVFRNTYTGVTDFWGDLDNAMRKTIRTGRTTRVGFVEFEQTGPFVRMNLPSGSSLYYLRPKIMMRKKPWGDVAPGITYEGLNDKGQWARLDTHPGKITENCLAGDTLVVTNRGAVPINRVREEDLLWDGVEWVAHNGRVMQGVKETITVEGVRMTPDHKVLINKKWREAHEVEGGEATSSFERHYGRAFRGALVRRRRGVGGRSDDASVPAPERLPSRADVRRPQRNEPVYDLMDAGPRHRFTVLTPTGEPMIVHNCVQAVARDLLAHGMLLARNEGLKIPLHVHDQVVCMEKEEEAEEKLKILIECMSVVPDWAPGLILGAEGFLTRVFTKD